MNDYTNAIEVRDLTKRYDGFTLDNLSFNVPGGSIMGFIGQNGAGKTTTINTILNIVKPDSGTVKVFGLDHIRDEKEIKKHIAAVFDELPFDDRLTASDINVIMREIYDQWDSDKFFAFLDRFQLPKKKKFGKFSKGMKMKMQIAAALSHNAKLLIMDEATTGLDPVVRNEILDIFFEFLQDEEHSILMSSHITSDLEKIADSVTFIDKGKLLISGCKDDILESHAILRCSRADYEALDKSDIVSARINDFSIDVMVSDADECRRRYPGIITDKANLDDIMLFYVNRDKKEWR
ncbi:MAG TPA: ABC transporter ATP-binding protein [Ruminococcus flavefaciens]|nr:ABC transporter ATP-binding protein [Ruminococcus flavefaciens]HQM01509.1 ABC transporter ATP-binding protein [Ruminococcus flavefaciens]